MRWWEEFRKPSLRCERIGHDLRPRLYRGYCTPKEVSGVDALCSRFGGAVAFRVNVTFHVCRRCKFEEERLKRVQVEYPIHSLQLNADRWRKLEADGYLLEAAQ